MQRECGMVSAEHRGCVQTEGQESSKCLRYMSKLVWQEPGFVYGMECARWLGLDCGGCESEQRTRLTESPTFPMCRMQRKECKNSLPQ